jgi:hypothetical protein
MTEHSDALSFEAVSRMVAQFLSSRAGRPLADFSESSRRLLDFITRRSGVLFAFGSNCDWLHRSFREYLAARRLLAFTGAEAARGTDLFHRWNQDAWKQVLLFLAALWRDQDVSHLLKPIAAEDPPHGLIFCGSAFAEGAAVDQAFEVSVIRRLCEAASRNAAGTICVRLVAGIRDDSVEKAKSVLRVIRQLSNRPAACDHFARLLRFMMQEARSWHLNPAHSTVGSVAQQAD